MQVISSFHEEGGREVVIIKCTCGRTFRYNVSQLHPSIVRCANCRKVVNNLTRAVRSNGQHSWVVYYIPVDEGDDIDRALARARVPASMKEADLAETTEDNKGKSLVRQKKKK